MSNNLSYFGSTTYGGVPTADIFHNYNRFYKNIESNYILKEYSIRNAPRPELLSHMLYGTTQYYWVLLLINEIYDPFYDWIMSEQAVHEYSEQKYQYVGGVHSIAYHVSEDGEKFWNVVEDPLAPGFWYDKGDLIKRYLQYKGTLIPMTNIEHEIEENEKKRVIKIIQPNDMRRFISDFNKQMESSNASIN